jgi:hypothetical protein
MPFPNPNPLHLRSALLRAIIPVGGTLLMGCEATGPRSPASVSLSVATMPAAITIGTGANSLKITNVQFVLAETEMAQAATRDPLQVDPILINLPLGAAAPRKVINASVSAGRYTALRAKLRAAGAAGGFGTLHPDWPAGVSVRVAGVYTDPGGVPHNFTFTSAADAQLQIAFAQPITVDVATRNVTMAVNVARWFRDARGTVMDPRNTANAAAIDANIGRSFQAFQDDDGNGVEDDPAEVEDDDTTEDEDDDTTEDEDEDDDTTEVEDDTTAVELAALAALSTPSRTPSTP